MNKIKIYFLLIITILSSILPSQVFAVDDMKMFSAQEILWYSTCTPSSSGGGGSGSGSGTAGSNVLAVMTFLVGKGFTLIQAAGWAGNFMQESTANIDPTIIQSGGNATDGYDPQNGDGFGIAQWTFDDRQVPLENFAKEQKKSIIDLSMQLDFFWIEALTKRLGATVEVSLATTIEDAVAAAHKFEGSNDADMTNRNNYAWQAYNQVKDVLKDGDPAVLQKALADAGAGNTGNTSGSSASVSNVCDGDTAAGNGAIAGDIVQTALNFALPEPAENGQFSKYPVVQAYNDYMKSVGRDPTSTDDSSDCGKFVAAVMRASGVDPDYKEAWVPSQYDYAVSKPDKYTVIRPAKESDLQPGDIMIADGGGSFYHTMIYTGKDKYPAVDASYTDRNPSVRTSAGYLGILNSDGLVIIRVKK